jgi:hypothetical protein
MAAAVVCRRILRWCLSKSTTRATHGRALKTPMQQFLTLRGTQSLMGAVDEMPQRIHWSVNVWASTHRLCPLRTVIYIVSDRVYLIQESIKDAFDVVQGRSSHDGRVARRQGSTRSGIYCCCFTPI